MLAGLSAVGAGLTVVFVVLMGVWVFAAHGDDNTMAVVRACGSVWLSLHLVPLTVGGNPLGLLPWLFVAVPVWCIWRAVRWGIESARPTQGYELALLVAYVSLTYTTVALAVSMFSSTPDLWTADTLSVVRTLTVVVVVSVACLYRYGGLAPRVTPLVRGAVRAGLTGGAFLYACGAAVVAGSLVLRMDQVRSVTALMAPDALDALFLTVLGLGYVPTAAAWGMAYVIGPGVALGAGASVTLWQSSPGRLPAFPLLAMLPAQAPRLGWVLLAVPVAAGVVMYAAIPRLPWRAADADPILRAPELAAAGIATLTAGAVVAVLCAASSGALGRDMLADVGPHAVAVTVRAMQICGGTCLALLVVPRAALLAIARSAARPRT